MHPFTRENTNKHDIKASNSLKYALNIDLIIIILLPMNNIVKFATLCLASFAMAGCSTNMVIGGVSTSTKTTVSCQYIKLKGEASHWINVEEGNVIKVEITTKSGMLDVTITDGKETPYEGHIDNDMNFTVNVDPGHYTIKLYGHDHSGSYKFDWGSK